jgi:four helix bundle protein
MAGYRDLVVWQAAMTLAEKCYQVTKNFPKDELFGMTAQIRRASASIPANIAEGRGRQGTSEEACAQSRRTTKDRDRRRSEKVARVKRE